MAFTPSDFNLAFGSRCLEEEDVVQYGTVEPIGLQVTITVSPAWGRNFATRLHGGAVFNTGFGDFFEAMTSALVRPVSPCCSASVRVSYPMSGTVTAACTRCSAQLDPDYYRPLIVHNHRSQNVSAVESWLTDRIGTLEAVLEAPRLISVLVPAADRHLNFLNAIQGDYAAFEAIADLLDHTDIDWTAFPDFKVCTSDCLPPMVSKKKPSGPQFQTYYSPELVHSQREERRYYALQEVARLRKAYLSDFVLRPYAYREDPSARPRLLFS